LLDDFVSRIQPNRCTVTGSFAPRGGIASKITCQFVKSTGSAERPR
jgi:NADPH-dependent 7-cyano-7-deazaguanine reductase QueF